MLPPIFQDTYIQASPERVYQALTSGAEWDAWFTSGTSVDPRPGGKIHFRWREWGPDYLTTEDGGAVLEAVPGRKFAFQWKPGVSVTTVAITLEPRGTGTLVQLSESGYQASGRDVIACLNCATGWGEALTLLKMYLEHGVTYGKVPE